MYIYCDIVSYRASYPPDYQPYKNISFPINL